VPPPFLPAINGRGSLSPPAHLKSHDFDSFPFFVVHNKFWALLFHLPSVSFAPARRLVRHFLLPEPLAPTGCSKRFLFLFPLSRSFFFSVISANCYFFPFRQSSDTPTSFFPFFSLSSMPGPHGSFSFSSLSPANASPHAGEVASFCQRVAN